MLKIIIVPIYFMTSCKKKLSFAIFSILVSHDPLVSFTCGLGLREDLIS
jgi:hypothetical protein